ncbi:uncharacterized protein [Triticum aestivum]|uniref:uncharacterized protein isoform X2 n=1 Tax=Triticum aestivum TaxID=4565 RepID=UPI001D003716|nr:uncharacterized protein LOC123133680 isoform X2 [Triticum aestivum]
MQSSRVVGKKKMALRPRAGATDSQAAGALFDKEHVAVTLGAAVRWKALCLFQKARRIGGSSPPPLQLGGDKRGGHREMTKDQRRMICKVDRHMRQRSCCAQAYSIHCYPREACRKNGSMHVMVSDLRPGKRKGNLRT